MAKNINKSFDERIDKILDKKNFSEQANGMIKKAIDNYIDYGVDPDRLENSLKNIIKIKEVDINDKKYTSGFIGIDENGKPIKSQFSHHNISQYLKNDGWGSAVNPKMQINVGIEKMDLKLGDPASENERDRRLSYLSQGIVECLSSRKEHTDALGGSTFYTNGMYRTGLYEIDNCVREQLANNICPNNNVEGNYSFDNLKSKTMSEYFDILMKFDGKYLVKNYFDFNEGFMNNPELRDLNEAIKNLKINVSSNDFDVSSEDKVLITDTDYFLKKDLLNLNNCFCEYANTKLKELPADEVDFYKGQIMSLPGMEERHLAILGNLKDTSIDRENFFNKNFNEIMEQKEQFQYFSVGDKNSAIYETLKNVSEYGGNDSEFDKAILKSLKNIEIIRYENREDLPIGKFKNAKFIHEEFNECGKNRDVIIKIGQHKLLFTDVISEEAFRRSSEAEKQELQYRNRDFVFGMVDALSVKESVYKKDDVEQTFYVMGMRDNYPFVGDCVKNFIAEDLYNKNIQFFEGKSISFDNKETNPGFVSFGNIGLKSHFDLLLENDGGYLIKNYFVRDENFINDKRIDNLDEAMRLSNGRVSNDFCNAYCEYLGSQTKNLTKDEFEFLENRVSSLEGMTNEHLKILEQARENAISENKDIDNSYKDINEKIKDDDINELN